MQDIESENVNNENITSQHPSNSTSKNNSAATTKRTQNFSFASTYQPSTGNFIKSQQIEFNSSNSKPSKTLIEETYISKPISSFSVLNNDDFYTSTLLVGSKPNAIVHPIRRYDQINLPIGEQHDQPSRQQQQQQQKQENDTDSTHTSQSQPYQYQLSGSSVAQPPLSHPSLNYTNNFAEEINRKLRYLHGSENHQAIPSWTITGYRHTAFDVGKHARGKSTTDSLTLTQRPLFITTVPTGVFLPPPKDMPLPNFLRPYVYSSHPMVLSDSHSSNYNKSPTFPKDKIRSSNAPINTADKDFMTTTIAAPSSLSSSSRINSSLQNYSQALAKGVHLTNEQFRQQIQQHRGKREVPREPYKNVMFDRRVVRGSNFSKIPIQPHYTNSELSVKNHQHQTYRYTPINDRSKRSISSRGKQPEQRDEIIQTDEEFLADDVKKKRTKYSVNTQTELLIYPNDFVKTSTRNFVDVSTDTSENDLFFQQGMEIQSLIDIFVDMCFEHSLVEMNYELQMDDLREKYETVQAEVTPESKISQDMENSQDDTTAAKLLQGHIAKLVPEVLENLESAEYIEPTKKDEVMKTICPWLTVEVAEEVGHIVDSREILTVIIEEIIKQRAAVYSNSKNMPEIVANIEEIVEISSENEQTDSKENI